MYLSLLTSWCDSLLSLQITEQKSPYFYGGILCPACGRIHGRCGDAIYPFMYMAKKTGDEKYLEGAKKLFLWTEYNMARFNGSLDNDTNSSWRGTTIFTAHQLCEALYYFGDLLDTETKQLWEERIKISLDFLGENIKNLSGNINYIGGYSALLAITEKYFGQGDSFEKAKMYAEKVLEQAMPDGLFCGEGIFVDAATGIEGNRVDLGYNVEETLGALATYAILTKDIDVEKRVADLLSKHLAFMLPDGGWDNSWGTRSYKWSYWGSRTADGCQIAYGLLSDYNPDFSSAVFRNTQLMQKCTSSGLLHGGPHYTIAGEPPCVHHTFCHAKALTTLLIHNKAPQNLGTLPRERQESTTYFPTIETYLTAENDWRGTVTAYSHDGLLENHPTGGALSLLWNQKVGLLCVSSMTKYKLIEPNNMQNPRQQDTACQTPRLEYEENGIVYTNVNDKSASLTLTGNNICAKGVLKNANQQGDFSFKINYSVVDNSFVIQACSQKDCIFWLPIVSQETEAIEEKDSAWIIEKGEHAVQISSSIPITLSEAVTSKINKYFASPLKKQITRQFNPVCGFQTIPFSVHVPKNQELTISIKII